ncbi:MAG: SAM-dependent methyltransferase [Endomicrobiales bacterium]|nr:SAM-dependent methyltransferase [Endomicrobiales bacterium]
MNMKNDKSMVLCDKCKKMFNGKKMNVVDDKPLCARCLYGDLEPFEIYPIGFVENGLVREKTGFGTEGEKGMSRIRLLESQRAFLYKLEDEKNITVVYYLHKTESVRSVFKRGVDGKEVGVFASRTPDRLSRIAVADVKLIQIEDTILTVDGLDAVSGSPVLDIKMSWND